MRGGVGAEEGDLLGYPIRPRSLQDLLQPSLPYYVPHIPDLCMPTRQLSCDKAPATILEKYRRIQDIRGGSE